MWPWNKLIGGSIAEPINAIGNVISKLHTTEGDKLTAEAKLQMAEAALTEIEQNLPLAQIAVNKIEAAHKSLFISGWRAAIGWTCAIGLFYDFLIRPIMIACHLNAISLDISLLITLTTSLLGVEGAAHLIKLRKKTEQP